MARKKKIKDPSYKPPAWLDDVDFDNPKSDSDNDTMHFVENEEPKTPPPQPEEEDIDLNCSYDSDIELSNDEEEEEELKPKKKSRKKQTLLGHVEFRKQSTLLSHIYSASKTLTFSTSQNNKNYIKCMSQKPDLQSTFWSKHSIVPYDKKFLIEKYPLFDKFINYKVSDLLHLRSLEDTEEHAPKIKRTTAIKLHKYSISLYMNWALLIEKKINLNDEMYKFFNETTATGFIKFLHELKLKENSLKNVIANLCKFASYTRNSIADPIIKHEILQAHLFFKSQMSSVAILVSKQVSKRNIQEELEAKGLYISDEQIQYAQGIVEKVFETFSNYLKQEKIECESFDLASEQEQEKVINWLMVKVGNEQICGKRWFAFQKAMQFALNIFLPTQRSENLVGMKIGALKEETCGDWVFWKRAVEKPDRSVEAAPNKPKEIPNQDIPIGQLLKPIVILYMKWIRPAVFKKMKPQKLGKESNRSTDFLWLAISGSTFTLNEDVWRQTMYEITFEIFGVGYHQRWIRNRMSNLLNRNAKTFEEAKSICNAMSHSMQVQQVNHET